MRTHRWIPLLVLAALIVILLWIAYQLWLPYLMTALDRKGELSGAGTFGDSYGALNTLFSGLAFSGIVVSVFLQSHELAETSRELARANTHQVLVHVLGEYRSLEMLAAVRGLWEFYRRNPSDLADSYRAVYRSESDRVSSLPLEQQLGAEKATLHFKRRLVSQFYQHLAGLYSLGIIDREILYAYWSESDLEIIPRILIPIELALMQELGGVAELPPIATRLPATLTRLKRLFDDCPRSEKAA